METEPDRAMRCGGGGGEDGTGGREVAVDGRCGSDARRRARFSARGSHGRKFPPQINQLGRRYVNRDYYNLSEA